MKPAILIVDDRKENLLVMQRLLDKHEAELFTASSGNEALKLTFKHDFALVLLDVQMPDMDGFETAELMRSAEHSAKTPIIFVSAIHTDRHHVFQGYSSGAVDYLFVPFEADILFSKVAIFLGMYLQRKELEEAKRELERIAVHDPLTGLYNRRHLDNIMEQEFQRSIRYGSDLSCMMIDLDHFKEVNDTFGHSFGDTVLREFANRISCVLRTSDFPFRYGGDEFLLLLTQTDEEGAVMVGEKICQLNRTEKYEDKKNSIFVTVSIGVASLQKHQPGEQNELIGFADKALYAAKENGRDQVVVYSL